MIRGITALVLAALAACDSGSTSQRVVGSDASGGEAGAGGNPADANPSDANPEDANPDDASPDADPADATTDADEGDAHSTDAGDDALADAGICAHWREFCSLFGCPNFSLCEAAVALEPDVKLTMQNTASGGHGECVASPSGVGGPSVYYSFAIPAGRYVNLVATPVGTSTGTEQRALIRVFSACNAAKVIISNIGGGSVPGEAAVCLRNKSSANQRVILAVSRYSGEYANLALTFELLVDFHDSVDDCEGSLFTL